MATSKNPASNANTKVVRAAQTGASSAKRQAPQPVPQNNDQDNGNEGIEGQGLRTVHVLKYTPDGGNETVENYTRFSLMTKQMRELLSQGVTCTVDRVQARVTQTVELAE